ncbi:MAG: GntR family transcriptional regulator [Candidatus Dormibacteraeota bacterium]|nr:GntR family transcriptional regulator [Candidatus Dormibacteraeota bacterium]MBO0762376.1 GntR family transcriptional regulator [Candidatus Dormibacteraeota bacterium]
MAAPVKRWEAEDSAVETIYSRLSQLILDGELAPGSPVPQARLATELGTSRIPLREAMRMLHADGLLTLERNRRPRVASLVPAELDALYANRILIESLCCRLTAKQFRVAWARSATRHLGAMNTAVEADNVDSWERHHRAFHSVLRSGASRHLRQMAQDAADRSERYRRVLHRLDRQMWSMAGSAKHQHVLEACQTGDPEGAGRSIAVHLAEIARVLLRQLAPQHAAGGIAGALAMLGIEGDGTAPGRRPPEPSVSGDGEGSVGGVA